ncbi:hypothetical protein Y032_0149g2722 [Ancylostoma ceylanicum]|uniref:Succinate dehydrogenase [ubiquinone] cytochrome b small subunit n=2 Tax=Ancylostoma ceylanicum TaxID=53326 RepID=A0A016T1K8_9BILA|nr:hypothetical protein Y032_0149g2722 [Ancylostoma ceylanicum]
MIEGDLMSVPLRSVVRVHRALLAARQMPRLCTPVTTSAIRAASTLDDGANKTHDHSLHFKLERYFAAAMVPLIPAAYFVHGPVMDAVLTVALTLHIHWGVQGVIQDYARPFVIGETLAKAARAGVYLITAALLAVMSKKKSKTQKKKFFSNPKNKNKVFKKKEKPAIVAKMDSLLRKRGAFQVLVPSGCDTIPHCSHGPCLLFGEREHGEIKSRFFACAVYRSDPTACAYKAEMDESNSIVKVDGEPHQSSSSKTNGTIESKKKPIGYGCIPKKLKEIPKTSTLVFCHECVDVFETKHKCPSEIVTRTQLRFPTKLLHPLEAQNGEAQFFFSEEALGVLSDAVDRSQADGVLCLGAPRLFETLRQQKNGRHLFLLDYDKRYAHFYPSRQFGQYSMLVDHFYDNKTATRLSAFFAECASVLLVCDPPFGVFIEPLMRSIESLKQRHKDARGTEPATFYGCIAIPMFVGKHILRKDKNYWMSDYRVTYDNHKVFAKPSKTTVRLFTDLKPDVFDLSAVDGYKFCEFCERYVSKDNKHCFMCSTCTSKVS